MAGKCLQAQTSLPAGIHIWFRPEGAGFFPPHASPVLPHQYPLACCLCDRQRLPRQAKVAKLHLGLGMIDKGRQQKELCC